MRSFAILFACLAVLFCAVVINHQAEGHGLRLKKLIKYGLVANALTGKKILLPLPLPLPIPIFQENVHHHPVPIHHNIHADIGYGFEHGGGIGYGHHGGGW